MNFKLIFTQGSLIPDTLKEMEENEEFKITYKNLMEKGQKQITREERKQRQRALNLLGVPDFQTFWQDEKRRRLLDGNMVPFSMFIYCIY